MFPLVATLAIAAPDVAEISGGAGHSCLARGDGAVQCWGGLDHATLLAGGEPATLIPTPVSGIDAVHQISAGGDNLTCAIRGAGEVWCWSVHAPPARVTGLVAAQVSVGNGHACAVAPGGTVHCWGFNGRGQLGDGTTTNRDAPVQVLGIDDATQVAAGFYHTCARRRTGRVACWGHDGFGQLGGGTVADAVPTPVPVRELEDAVQVDAGSFHTCALSRDGQVACWGSNRSGQLGDGTRGASVVPVGIPTLRDAARLDLGMDHGCAVRRSGEVWCWGSNEVGQLGNRATTDHLAPVRVEGVDAVTVSAGHQHTCALERSGHVSCWGQNFSGQLGDGQRTPHARPAPIVLGP